MRFKAIIPCVAVLVCVSSVAFAQTRPHWLQISNKPVIDVRGCGATGDGTTDDSSAISSAIASLTSGAVLFFPRGTYISTNQTIATSGVTVLGVGKGSRLKLKGGTQTALLTCTSAASDLTIQNIVFDGNRANQTRGASRSDQILVVCDGDRTTIGPNVEFASCIWGAGLQIGGGFTDVANCFFQDMGDTTGDDGCDGIHIGDGTGLTQTQFINISNCMFQNISDFGVGVDYSDYVTVSDCHFTNTTAYGVAGVACFGGNGSGTANVMENCTVIGNNYIATAFQPNVSVSPNAGSWIMRNCYVEGVTAAAITLGNYHYFPCEVSNVTASGCNYLASLASASPGIAHKITHCRSWNNRSGVLAYDSQAEFRHEVSMVEAMSDRSFAISRGVTNTDPTFKFASASNTWTISDTTNGVWKDDSASFFASGTYLQITGNGASTTVGLTYQAVGTGGVLTPNVRYTLNALVYLSGRTAGDLYIRIFGTGVDTGSVLVDEDTTSSTWTKYSTTFLMPSVPNDLQIQIYGENTPNASFTALIGGVWLVEGIDTRIAH